MEGDVGVTVEASRRGASGARRAARSASWRLHSALLSEPLPARPAAPQSRCGRLTAHLGQRNCSASRAERAQGQQGGGGSTGAPHDTSRFRLTDGARCAFRAVAQPTYTTPLSHAKYSVQRGNRSAHRAVAVQACNCDTKPKTVSRSARTGAAAHTRSASPAKAQTTVEANTVAHGCVGGGGGTPSVGGSEESAVYTVRGTAEASGGPGCSGTGRCTQWCARRSATSGAALATGALQLHAVRRLTSACYPPRQVTHRPWGHSPCCPRAPGGTAHQW